MLLFTAISRWTHHALTLGCVTASIDRVHVMVMVMVRGGGVPLATLSLYQHWLIACHRFAWHRWLTHIVVVVGSFRLTEEKVLVRVPTDL